MTDLLDRAFLAARDLPSGEQDAVARVLLDLVQDTAVVRLSPGEREDIARSKEAAARADFATNEEVSAVWAKCRV